MAGISKTPNGKWRGQIRRRGIYLLVGMFSGS